MNTNDRPMACCPGAGAIPSREVELTGVPHDVAIIAGSKVGECPFCGALVVLTCDVVGLHVRQQVGRPIPPAPIGARADAVVDW